MSAFIRGCLSRFRSVLVMILVAAPAPFGAGRPDAQDFMKEVATSGTSQAPVPAASSPCRQIELCERVQTDRHLDPTTVLYRDSYGP